MASNENEVQSVIIDITSKDFVIAEEGNFQSFKMTAQKFIDEVLKYYQMSIRTQRVIKTENLKNGLQYFYQYMRENTNFTQNILQLQAYFEQQLNNFLGRTINLAWVSKEGHLTFIDEAYIGQIYTKAFGQFGRGGIDQSTLDNINSNIEQALINKFKESQQLRIGVYTTIRDRWLDPKNKQKFYYHGYYQNFNRRKYTRRFPNLGKIAEGYAETVINSDPEIAWKQGQPEEKREYSIRRLYERPQIKLDSTAGSLKGDVIFKTDQNSGNIHFAIKEGSFSTAKFGQFFALAQKILQIQEITKEEFQAQMGKLIRINDLTRQVLQAAYIEAEKEADDILLKKS